MQNFCVLAIANVVAKIAEAALRCRNMLFLRQILFLWSVSLECKNLATFKEPLSFIVSELFCKKWIFLNSQSKNNKIRKLIFRMSVCIVDPEFLDIAAKQFGQFFSRSRSFFAFCVKSKCFYF